MLPTKDLKDVLKDAQTVTSLGSEALVVCDSNGVPKKTSKAALFSEINDYGVNLVPGSLKKLVTSVYELYIPAGTPVVVSFDSYEVVNGEAPSSFRIISRKADGTVAAYLGVTAENPASFISQGKISLYVHHEGYSNNKGYFHKMKIEKGYKASKWSPAPEDFISLFGGGGKSLPFNKLRNLAERRVA